MQLPAPLLSIIDQAIAIVYGFQPWVEPTVVLGMSELEGHATLEFCALTRDLSR